jgi:HEAT repeat protein
LKPRERIDAECKRRGKDALVAGCIALLEGRETDGELLVALGGPPALWAVTGGAEGPRYWRRVWAARGLLWAWDDVAAPAVVAALRDDAWRVREMAAKVVARHRLGDALPVVVDLRDDPTPRVRAAAARAVVLLTSARA